MDWINSEHEHIAACGWSTLSSVVSIQDNDQINMDLVDQLLDRVETSLHRSKNRVKYTMNGFVISVGSYIPELNVKAHLVASRLGR